ncbi:MAG TPA: diacylglycerol kinase family protein [Candidatus Paceibacterota bacterium]|nr:diacylglycerol kinase family protein [Candidatus Paceibacterota bacterium]
MRKTIKSFGYAAVGIGYALSGRNFRIQSAIGAIGLALAYYLHIARTEWLFIISAIGFVLALEATNTALEEVCNKFHPESHPHIALIKDLAAGAVLIASLTALTIGILIFWPKLF